jgi:hypothetical protein
MEKCEALSERKRGGEAVVDAEGNLIGLHKVVFMLFGEGLNAVCFMFLFGWSLPRSCG